MALSGRGRCRRLYRTGRSASPFAVHGVSEREPSPARLHPGRRRMEIEFPSRSRGSLCNAKNTLVHTQPGSFAPLSPPAPDTFTVHCAVSSRNVETQILPNRGNAGAASRRMRPYRNALFIRLIAYRKRSSVFEEANDPFDKREFFFRLSFEASHLNLSIAIWLVYRMDTDKIDSTTA